MVRKIKVNIQTEQKRMNLPAIPLSWLPFFLKLAIRVQAKAVKNEEGETLPFDQVKAMKAVQQFLQVVKPAMRNIEPFTLVEVESDDAYVLIEMR